MPALLSSTVTQPWPPVMSVWTYPGGRATKHAAGMGGVARQMLARRLWFGRQGAPAGAPTHVRGNLIRHHRRAASHPASRCLRFAICDGNDAPRAPTWVHHAAGDLAPVTLKVARKRRRHDVERGL